MPRQYHLVRGWWGSGAGLWGDVMDGLHVESIILGQLQGASKQPGFFSLVWLHCEECGILVPSPGIEPLQWKHGVLTTRPPGKSQVGQFQKGRIVCSVFRVKDCDSHPCLTPPPSSRFLRRRSDVEPALHLTCRNAVGGMGRGPPQFCSHHTRAPHPHS